MRWYDPLNYRIGAGVPCRIKEEVRHGHRAFLPPKAVDEYFKVAKLFTNTETQHEKLLSQKDIHMSELLAYDDPNYEYYENYQIWQLVFQAITSEADLQMLYLRFVRGLTLEEIGTLFYLSRERIRQRIQKIICKMRRRVCQLGIEQHELLPV